MGCEWWTGEEWDWDMILIGTWCGFVRQYMMKTRTIARNETRRGYETWGKRNGVSTAQEWCVSIGGWGVVRASRERVEERTMRRSGLYQCYEAQQLQGPVDFFLSGKSTSSSWLAQAGWLTEERKTLSRFFSSFSRLIISFLAMMEEINALKRLSMPTRPHH